MRRGRDYVGISGIVAISSNSAMGYKGKLPWDHNRHDLRFFSAKTAGKPLIMGRKTYVSMLNAGVAWKTREPIVVTSLKGRTFVPTVKDAIERGLAIAREKMASPEIMVIGGVEIFKEAWIYMDRFYITLINQECKGDKFFPFGSKHFLDWTPTLLRYGDNNIVRFDRY